jgi:hypothetical protein
MLGNQESIFLNIIFGSIGLGFFLYGKKQQRMVPLSCGIALMIFPYFVSGTALLVVVGLVLTAIPYFIRY